MQKRTHFDVLVIGSACVDIVFSGMPHWPKLGHELYVSDFALGAGSIFNTAASLSRLGLRVGLLTELGNDFFSRFILDEIDQFGISRDLIIVHNHPMRSVSVCLAHEGERGFVSYADIYAGKATRLLDALSPSHHPDDHAAVRQILQSLAIYDFDAVFMYAQPHLHPLLDLFQARGVPIFFDTGWHPEGLDYSLLFDVIKRANVIMPNFMEATSMTGTQTAEDAALTLANHLPIAIVKMGAQGVVACRQGQLTYCPALPIKEVVDTTGAGDAFNAGFIYGTLKGYSFTDALRCGTICGGLSTTALTGTAAVPTADELEQLRAQ